MTRLIDGTSDAAMELKTWELRNAFWSWQTLCRKESLLHKILAHMDGSSIKLDHLSLFQKLDRLMDGQFRTRRGM